MNVHRLSAWIRNGGWQRAVPWLACGLGIFVVFEPMLSTRLGLTHGGLADGRLINYTLEHGYRWLTQTPPHEQFWNTPLFHPHPNVTAYTDVLIGAGPPYWFLRALGLPPDTSFQLWMLVVWSGNYALAYLMLRRGLGVSRPAAALGAWLFAFGGIQRIRFRHQQFIALAYVLLAATAVAAAFDERRTATNRRTWIAVFFAAVTLQAYTAFYPFFFYGALLAAFAGWGLVLPESRGRFAALLRDHGRWVTGAALACILAIAPLAAHYKQAADEVGGRSLERYEHNIPHLSSWLLMGQSHPLYGGLARSGLLGPGATDKHANGLGFVTLGLVSFGLWQGRRRIGVALLALATATVVVLFTRFGGAGAWDLLHAYLPGASAIRAVGRVGMVLALPGAVGLALGIDRLLGSGRKTAAVLLTVAILVEQQSGGIPKFTHKPTLRHHIARVAAGVDPSCDAFLLTYPPGDAYVDDDAAWVQLATGVPTVNGRFGNEPPGWELGLYQSDRPAADRRRLREELDQWVQRNGLEHRQVCWIEDRGLVQTRSKTTRSGSRKRESTQ